MNFIVNVNKINLLMIEKGYKNKMELFKDLKDVQHASFYKLMQGKTKYRTSINLAMNISKTLNINVEEIITEVI